MLRFAKNYLLIVVFSIVAITSNLNATFELLGSVKINIDGQLIASTLSNNGISWFALIKTKPETFLLEKYDTQSGQIINSIHINLSKIQQKLLEPKIKYPQANQLHGIIKESAFAKLNQPAPDSRFEIKTSKNDLYLGLNLRNIILFFTKDLNPVGEFTISSQDKFISKFDINDTSAQAVVVNQSGTGAVFKLYQQTTNPIFKFLIDTKNSGSFHSIHFLDNEEIFLETSNGIFKLNEKNIETVQTFDRPQTSCGFDCDKSFNGSIANAYSDLKEYIYNKGYEFTFLVKIQDHAFQTTQKTFVTHLTLVDFIKICPDIQCLMAQGHLRLNGEKKGIVALFNLKDGTVEQFVFNFATLLKSTFFFNLLTVLIEKPEGLFINRYIASTNE